MVEEYRTFKKFGLIFGIIFIILGISLFIYGTTYWGSGSKEKGEEGWFEENESQSNLWFRYSALGMLFLFIGGALIYVTQIRKITKYYATETSPAIKTVGGAIGEGVADGIQRGGGIRITDDRRQNGPREVIKVKCRSCGYLETEDAEFCSKCGKKI